MAKSKDIIIEGEVIRFYTDDNTDFISLTDIDKRFEGNGRHIENWLRNQNTIEFLETWEEIHNPDFNSMQLHEIKEKTGLNRFLLSAKKWTDLTGAIGIKSKRGKYGGTFAHPDIAFNFCLWLSPRFQLYVAKEFTRLKREENESRRTELEWSVRRELTKINYHIHKDAVKLLVPPKLDKLGKRRIFASEGDLINLALFGMTAEEWRVQNTDLKGNVRDHASMEQLTVLANLENLNAYLIESGFEQDERLELLNKEARKQIESFIQYDRTKGMRKLE